MAAKDCHPHTLPRVLWRNLKLGGEVKWVQTPHGEWSLLCDFKALSAGAWGPFLSSKLLLILQAQMSPLLIKSSQAPPFRLRAFSLLIFSTCSQPVLPLPPLFVSPLDCGPSLGLAHTEEGVYLLETNRCEA